MIDENRGTIKLCQNFLEQLAIFPRSYLSSPALAYIGDSYHTIKENSNGKDKNESFQSSDSASTKSRSVAVDHPHHTLDRASEGEDDSVVHTASTSEKENAALLCHPLLLVGE